MVVAGQPQQVRHAFDQAWLDSFQHLCLVPVVCAHDAGVSWSEVVNTQLLAKSASLDVVDSPLYAE